MEYQNGQTLYINGQLYYFNEPDGKWYPVPMRVAVGSGGGRRITNNIISGGSQLLGGVLGITGNLFSTFGTNSTANPIEINRQVPMAKSGTISNFYVSTTTTQSGLGSLIITIRRNGINSSIIITINPNAPAGVYSNTTDSLSVNAGDLISISFQNAAGTTQISGFSAKFE